MWRSFKSTANIIHTYLLLLARTVRRLFFFFFFNDTAPPEFYPFSLPAALPISVFVSGGHRHAVEDDIHRHAGQRLLLVQWHAELFKSAPELRIDLVHRGELFLRARGGVDRKSTRLNSSHLVISYAVFCLKKKQT